MSIAFDRAADFYDDTRGFPAGIEQDVAKLFQRVGNIQPETTLVEPGIGTGRIALPLAALTGATFVGVDLAAPMMLRLREKQNGEQIQLVHGDATKLPLADHVFDAAIVTHVFHLIPNWRDALAELARVLKPEGVLLYSWTTHDREGFFDTWRDVVNAFRKRSSFEQFSGTEHLSEWTLKVPAQSITYTTERTPGAYIESIKNRIWSSTWSMTDEQIEKGVALLQESMATHNLTPESHIQQQAHFHVTAYTP